MINCKRQGWRCVFHSVCIKTNLLVALYYLNHFQWYDMTIWSVWGWAHHFSLPVSHPSITACPCHWHCFTKREKVLWGRREEVRISSTSGAISGYFLPLLFPRHLGRPPSNLWHQNPLPSSKLQYTHNTQTQLYMSNIHKCSLTEWGEERDSHKSLGVVEDGCDPQEPLNAVHHQGWVRSKQGAVYNMELQRRRQFRKQIIMLTLKNLTEIFLIELSVEFKVKKHNKLLKIN